MIGIRESHSYSQSVDKRRKFYKWLSKNNDFKEIKGGNAKDLGLHIQKELKPIGFEISNDALNLLIDKTGGNSRLAITEALKLATFVGLESSGRIEQDDVREMVPDSLDSDFFETTDVFFTGNLQSTLDSIGRIFLRIKKPGHYWPTYRAETVYLSNFVRN